MSEKFEQLIDEFCNSLHIEKNASEHTSRNYRVDLEAFAMWAERMGLDPLKVNYRQLRGYLAEMDGAQYARTTINRKLSSLRSFFKWLDITGKANNNFASVMQGPKINKHLPQVVRHDDIDRLIEQCHKEIDEEKKQAVRDLAIIELMYATGARISEIAGLKIKDVDFASGQVKYFGKGKKERIVPVYSIALNTLNDYIQNYRKSNLEECFIGARGGAMSADSIRSMFKKKCERAGISTNVSPHTMRHTFATDVLDGGADLRSVQEMLGHASLSTTQIYTHLSAKKLKDVHSQAHPRG
ncbi:MAG: tyrosine recombinase XerC [Coriobacteriia bacterium]|nr:tyrosine recombinase XerC [Coriobacteriia bacterium]